MTDDPPMFRDAKFWFRLLVATMLSAFLVGCADQETPQQSVPGDGEGAPTAVNSRADVEDTGLQPGKEPENTVEVLYSNDRFFGARNHLSPESLEFFSCCFTQDLIDHFDSFNVATARWLEEHAGEALKLPVREGPIFLSNYEGADDFRVGDAMIDRNLADVPVQFTYTQGDETVAWVDIVRLRLVNGVWLLDDIRFDPEQYSDFTLRKRVSLGE